MELVYILVLETRFYRFESCIGHLVLLAQWIRAVGYEPMCREFESLKGRLTNLQKFVNIYYVQEDVNSVASDWGSTPHNSITRGCQGFDGVVRLYLLTEQTNKRKQHCCILSQ
jgi:hypothetical protein